MTDPLEWINKALPYFGSGVVGALIISLFKYKGVVAEQKVKEKEVDAEAEDNKATHTEKSFELVQAALEKTVQRLEEKVERLEASNEVTQNNYLALREKHLELSAIHKECEAKITGLQERMQTFVDGQARTEMRYAEREREYEAKVRELADDNHELRGLCDFLRGVLKEHQIEEQAKPNTETLLIVSQKEEKNDG